MCKKLILLLGILVVLTNSLLAQLGPTLYFMDRVPQFHELNPAFQPKCDLYLGCPGASGINLDAGNSSISLNDIFIYDKGLDSLITFMHPAYVNGKNKFVDKLKDDNSFFTNIQVPAIDFGFRINSWYVTIGLKEKTIIDYNYPKDLAKMEIFGIDSAASYNFNNFNMTSFAYAEFSLGLSKKLDNELTIGARGKLLVGQACLSTNNKKFELNTSVKDGLYNYEVNSDIAINSYNFIDEVPLDSLNEVSIDKVKAKNFSGNYFKSFYQNIGDHMGYALDLGATYGGIDRLLLSASVLDIGFINWKSGENNITLTGVKNYNGFIIDLLDDSAKLGENFADSIKAAFKMVPSSKSFTTWLPVKFYVGAEYSPAEYFSLGLLYLSQYYNKTYYQQIVTSATLKPFKMIEFTANYSILDNGFSYMGGGFALRLGPLQMYLMSDKIPFYYSKQYIPYKAQSVNLRLGLNLVFGCDKERKMKDKPLIYE